MHPYQPPESGYISAPGGFLLHIPPLGDICSLSTTKGGMRMTSTTSARHAGTSKRRRKTGSAGLRLFKGLGAALVVTIAGVAIFALLMQWIRPTDGTVRIFNQVLKLLSIGVGVFVCVGCGQEGGLLRGAFVGLVYMALGVGVYALLSGQAAPWTAYLADLGMGVAGGGIVGMILSNMNPR